MIVHFFRHGMTEANRRGLYYGSTDLPLCEEGVEELKRLKKTLALPAADCYVTSGLRRAKESLRILFDETPGRTLDELNEFDFGDFEMKTYEELKDDPAYVRWCEGNDDTTCPNGESKTRFLKRIKRGMEIVGEIGAETVVVVCHGGVIGTLMEALFPGRREHYHAWVPPCGRGYSVVISDEALTYETI